MTRLILIRHGETDWNLEGRYQGQSDVPLNERGRIQSAELIPELKVKMPSAIYCSDLSRSFETAEIIGRALSVPVVRDRRLREIHLGVWEGMLFQEIQAKYSELLSLRKKDAYKVSAPGGETLEQVRIRVLAASNDIIRKHPNETAGLVSHGLPLALLLARHQGRSMMDVWDLIPQNALPTELVINGEL